MGYASFVYVYTFTVEDVGSVSDLKKVFGGKTLSI